MSVGASSSTSNNKNRRNYFRLPSLSFNIGNQYSDLKQYDIIGKVSQEQKPETARALRNENATIRDFVLNNENLWKTLNPDQMRETIDALEGTDPERDFVQNNPERWLSMDVKQMVQTRYAIGTDTPYSGPTTCQNVMDLVLNDGEFWDSLSADQMGATRSALTRAKTDDVIHFIKNNKERWLKFDGRQMLATKTALEGNAASRDFVIHDKDLWDSMDGHQMYGTEKALTKGGESAQRFIRNNPEIWVKMDSDQMRLTVEALHKNIFLKKEIEDNPKGWANRSVRSMQRKIDEYVSPEEAFMSLKKSS